MQRFGGQNMVTNCPDKKGHSLSRTLRSGDVKSLRVSLSGLMDAAHLVLETLARFGSQHTALA